LLHRRLNSSFLCGYLKKKEIDHAF